MSLSQEQLKRANELLDKYCPIGNIPGSTKLWGDGLNKNSADLQEIKNILAGASDKDWNNYENTLSSLKFVVEKYTNNNK